MLLHILIWKYLVCTNIYALKIDYFAFFFNKLSECSAKCSVIDTCILLHFHMTVICKAI